MLRADPDWREELKDGRQFQRVPVQASASLVSSALGRVDATLIDLSQSGCRIRVRVRCERGDHFVLRIGSIGPRAVVTAWRRGDEVGLAFAQPLAWAVVAGIAFPTSVELSSANS